MNQNTIPNQPDQNEGGNPYAGGQPGSHDRELGSNPYYSQQYSESSQAELDAGAPLLKSSDSQRVNKKALLFLAGIVGLLALMGLLVFKNGASRQEEAAKPDAEQVVVPELPTAAPQEPQVPAAPPIELAEQAPPVPPPTALAIPRSDPEGDFEPMGPSLRDRRMMSAEGGMAGSESAAPSNPYAQAMMAAGMMGNQAKPAAASEVELPTSAQFLSNPDALLVRGTYIRCAMETRIITDVDGFASCVVTEPVYSINGRRLLLPKGSKVSGKYNGAAVRRDRVAVVWDRITTPNGIDVAMMSPGTDNLGGAGHPGDYNAHWGSRISSALFISLLSDAFKYAGEKNGPTTTTSYGNGNVVEEPFQSNTARTLEQLANQAVSDAMGRRPTVTINQGTIVNIYVAKDVDFTGVLRN